MDNFWYLFTAYTLVWLGLFIYIFSLSGREKQLGEAIEDLKETLAKLGKKEDR